MLQLPGKNIAFVFSDPAGANACVALANECRKEGVQTFLFSNRSYLDKDPENFIQTEAVPDFAQLHIDCVFTGTSHPESSSYFEVNCIREAKKDHIHTISFIDHWVNFKLRFTGLETSELPDEIWVLDETARSLAAKEGLPTEKLHVHPNPYHVHLKQQWRSKYRAKEYLKQLNIPQDGYHILFAPDPLSLRKGKETAGFTEDEALKDLIESLPADRSVHLIIKSHPLQPPAPLIEQLEKNKNVNAFLVSKADTLELINASDLVIGFYSNLLLEAEALGKPVLRYFPGKPEADLLQHKKSLRKIESRSELQSALKHCIYG